MRLNQDGRLVRAVAGPAGPLQERRVLLAGEQWPRFRRAHEGLEELRGVLWAIAQLGNFAELLFAAADVDERVPQCGAVLSRSSSQVELGHVGGHLGVFGGHGARVAGFGAVGVGLVDLDRAAA